MCYTTVLNFPTVEILKFVTDSFFFQGNEFPLKYPLYVCPFICKPFFFGTAHNFLGFFYTKWEYHLFEKVVEPDCFWKNYSGVFQPNEPKVGSQWSCSSFRKHQCVIFMIFCMKLQQIKNRLFYSFNMDSE